MCLSCKDHLTRSGSVPFSDYCDGKLCPVSPGDFYCSYKDIKPKTKLNRKENEKRVTADLIITKLQCSLCATLLYSALPMWIENCLSAVSDLKEFGLFKSLISHCEIFSDFFYRRKVPCFLLKATLTCVFFEILLDKTSKKQNKSMRHYTKERYLMAPNSRKV